MKISFAFLALSLTATAALAEPPKTYEQHRTATAKLLAAQRSGELAGDRDQHLSGQVQSEVYKRYVKSFAQPIPQTFINQTFTNE